MDMYGAMMLFLILLPVYGLGWIGGMLHMRSNYLKLLNAERRDKRQILRYARK